MESLLSFLRRRLWPAAEPASRFARALLAAARYAFALGRDLATGELSLRAMSLVYTTMLAIVPTLGFAFSLATFFGMHNRLEPMLSRALEPIGPRAEELAGNVTSFVDNVNSPVLGGLSVALLLLTVISMAQKVESSFNYVWRVDRPRSFARRASEYLSLILVGPLIMFVAAGLIASLSSVAVVERLRETEVIGWGLAYVGAAVPYAMIVAAFVFLYLVIPNTRVRLKPALIGGCVGGVSWTASGYVFADLVGSSARLEAIYSGFAILFIAMIWLYLSWLILLLGSQLAYYVQHPFHLRFGQRTEPIDNGTRERLSLGVMFLIASDYARPSHGWTSDGMAAALRVPRNSLDSIMAALGNAGLVAKTSEERLVPGRDPHRIALADIVASVRGRARRDVDLREDWHATVDSIVDRIDAAIEGELGERSLGELVDLHLARE